MSFINEVSFDDVKIINHGNGNNDGKIDFEIVAKYGYNEVVLSETLPPDATEDMVTSGFDLSLYRRFKK